MKRTVIIAAAGSGRRFGGELPKQYLRIDGVTVLEKALDAFCSFNGEFDEFIIASSDPEECAGYLSKWRQKLPEGVSFKIVMGGKERQDSIANAVMLACGDQVFIHDAARPFVSRQVIQNVMDALDSGEKGAIPCVRPKNTIRTENESFDRSKLYEVQTPQGFVTNNLKKAYALACSDGFRGTDDASVVEHYAKVMRTGNKIKIVDGDYENIKITTPSDMPGEIRFGNGYDVHRLVPGRPLMLGCTKIPYEKGLLGHSDADVLSHAIADAILGAASLPDIGNIFPDNSPETEGMAGSEILRISAEMVRKIGYTIMMVDSTVIAEKPKLMPHIKTMRENTAKALGIYYDRVNIKATTEERMSDVSRNGMAALATCVLVKNFSSK